MAFKEYASMDGLALGRLVRAGEITAAALMDAAIARERRRSHTRRARGRSRACRYC